MIREAKKDDLYRLLQLYTHLHNNCLPSDYKSAHQIWDKILADDNHHVIVAEKDGMLIS